MGENKEGGGEPKRGLTERHATTEGDETPESDKSLRIGSSHGADTVVDERAGYARDITQEGHQSDASGDVRTRGSGLSDAPRRHPSKSLEARHRGFGIGGGYERPYRKEKPKPADSDRMYGPLPHAGYYGDGTGAGPFKRGQAGFSYELSWYRSQYGEKTSGYDKKKG